ncbi:D-3-phosphoglycerate dehydrogenase [Trichodelitschia bisporula]|uniref:2-oxoglutarate reductase n=1 Tax=Trichodelitschia bisporula TaxID=703511 RepID=A0A6G1I4V3_9PEZI|nr:D-3-phosphoglycerate dehydrogenase [Trichodelitschia bisporula]
MSSAQDIVPRVNKTSRSVSNSWTNNLSTSPTVAFHSSQTSNMVRRNTKPLQRFETKEVKVLLLENVNETGVDILRGQGYQVETVKSSLSENELIERISDIHVIGIRSKTKLTARVLNAAKNLLVIGCFCIGTNQVDLKTAASHGIAVFNSPFSNSRSVAELTLAEIVALARQLGDRSMELHKGIWNKVSAGCWEVRGKTLGIVGYGHIGSQLSVLAESFGLSVIYYDVIPLMGLGTAKQVDSLKTLLSSSDFVSLHVPELAETKGMIGAEELAAMRDGSYLINNARGSVVDIPALVNAIRSGKLAGAAIDVYPHEPAGNGPYFNAQALDTWASDLQTLPNVLLTPHVGGSTEEAQSAIGVEVGHALVRYVNEGSTQGAVNMPEVNLRSLTMDEPDHARVIFIHKNVPGVLRNVNKVLENHNVDKQMTDSRGDVAYLMADVSGVTQEEMKTLYQSLEDLQSRIRTRILY